MRFSLAIIALLLAIGIPATYYFAIALPKQNNERFLSEQKIRCKEAGEQRYKEELAQYKESVDNGLAARSVSLPEFHFNNRLKTCLYSNEAHLMHGIRVLYTERYIIDLYSNNNIDSYIEFSDGSQGGSLKFGEFLEEKRRLFSE